MAMTLGTSLWRLERTKRTAPPRMSSSAPTPPHTPAMSAELEPLLLSSSEPTSTGGGVLPRWYSESRAILGERLPDGCTELIPGIAANAASLKTARPPGAKTTTICVVAVAEERSARRRRAERRRAAPESHCSSPRSTVRAATWTERISLAAVASASSNLRRSAVWSCSVARHASALDSCTSTSKVATRSSGTPKARASIVCGDTWKRTAALPLAPPVPCASSASVDKSMRRREKLGLGPMVPASVAMFSSKEIRAYRKIF
mmetsp:Transcript_44027/g.104229  ORF Transcript_44027/g.104229 Transcript_44027/m.104229 type:complete len:261 (-) Transcript_44027:938-1720(-)